MPSAGRSAAARETEWRGGKTRFEMAETRTWCSQNSERHIKFDGLTEDAGKDGDVCVPTNNPPGWGCRHQKGRISP